MGAAVAIVLKREALPLRRQKFIDFDMVQNLKARVAIGLVASRWPHTVNSEPCIQSSTRMV
jgi:hypothetical protein